MKWNNIKSVMPEISKPLILCSQSNELFHGDYRVDKFSNKSNLFVNIDEYWGIEKEITHWIYEDDFPFPNQPERSKREDYGK